MKYPLTGVAAIITYQDKILIGKRIDLDTPSWQLPGGLIELGETPNQAVIRETLEETNLQLQNEQLIAVTNNVFCASDHSISLIFKAKCKNPTKLNLEEKNKCGTWYWETWDKLPQPLFLPLQILFDSGYHPFHAFNNATSKNKTNNCFIF